MMFTLKMVILSLAIVSNPSVIRKREPQYVQIIEISEDAIICGPATENE